MIDAWLAPVSFLVEAVFGYPRKWRHPIEAIGYIIRRIETRWNVSPYRRLRGVAAILLIAGGTAFVVYGLVHELGFLIGVLLCSTGLAARSLDDHVSDVLKDPKAVSRIVGRDTEDLDESGIVKAAIESLAESFNDGVVAPAFWLVLAGPAGLFAYKAVNTADSLIGHKTERFLEFGWASARLDDLMNLIPARIAGCLIALAGGGGWRIMWRDAGRHVSPNAGWPEAAMAGALGRQLGGPVSYDGVPHERPWLGDGPAPQRDDLVRALTIYRRASLLLWGLLLCQAL